MACGAETGLNQADAQGEVIEQAARHTLGARRAAPDADPGAGESPAVSAPRAVARGGGFEDLAGGACSRYAL
ncbi:hypothetical protein GCM10010357_71530 [Streptomyces luteireticuli]|uniref:Uncharacterized protein n=1 Tax=Streptomyces luteireticuli TaxID=173858 RepID=A0ABP3J333_9ACTN